MVLREGASGPRRQICAGVLVLLASFLGIGCGGASASGGDEADRAVPPEIAAQLKTLEQAMNGNPLADPAKVFDASAAVHLIGRLAYGSVEEFIEEIGRSVEPVSVEFVETSVLFHRPDRVRTVTSVATVQEEARSIDRIAHEWVRDGERWVAREQSYCDWSPLVGDWVRVEDGGERAGLRLLPTGRFELRAADSTSPRRAGTYASAGEIVSVVPEPSGVASIGAGEVELRHRFEFGGSLLLEAASADGLGESEMFEGTWRRRRPGE